MIPVTSHLIVLSQTVSLPVPPTADSQNTPEGVWTRSMAGGGFPVNHLTEAPSSSPNAPCLGHTHTHSLTHTHNVDSKQWGGMLRARTHIHTRAHSGYLVLNVCSVGVQLQGGGSGSSAPLCHLDKTFNDNETERQKKNYKKMYRTHMGTQTVSQFVVFCRVNLYQIWNFILKQFPGAVRTGGRINVLLLVKL